MRSACLLRFRFDFRLFGVEVFASSFQEGIGFIARQIARQHEGCSLKGSVVCKNG